MFTFREISKFCARAHHSFNAKPQMTMSFSEWSGNEYQLLLSDLQKERTAARKEPLRTENPPILQLEVAHSPLNEKAQVSKLKSECHKLFAEEHELGDDFGRHAVWI
ncbi:unnamed protein product [Oikopleura dioica]|uniref:Uncharacterized protein n=1 Tax=Oikopleura dioica TaxID=34765 RepID=E4XYS9_OIKDI|nr:unnamed protein product [Oikopleura dioica]